MITEDQLEQLCLEWFNHLGYTCLSGYDIAPDGASPERKDYRQVVLFGRLLSCLQAINPQIPLATLELVAHQVTKPETPVPIKNNKAFHQQLLEGVKVEFKQDGKDKTDYVRLVDFNHAANNQFLVVKQFTIIGSKGKRRPDLIVFINGLPLAVIELKNPIDISADIWAAWRMSPT